MGGVEIFVRHVGETAVTRGCAERQERHGSATRAGDGDGE
jgi:hypothetical protein